MSATSLLPKTDAFEAWHDRAGVRIGPRRMIEIEDDIHKAFFPEALVPHLNHPFVDPENHELRRYLAAQHLFQWLQFTMHFEVSVVNRATQRIGDGSTGLVLPVGTRMTAYKIIIDEGYHSLYSLDVLQQLEQRSGIISLPYDFTSFLQRLDSIGYDLPDQRLLIQLFQVVVFETLITSILADIPNDQTLISVVRETVRDHAIDEGRHHAFFASFFTYLWGQLDPAIRHRMASYLPSLIVRSLQPATRPAHLALRQAGFAEPVARQIVEESFNRDAVLASIRTASRKTVRLFQEHGVLELPGVRDRFIDAGLDA